MLKIKSITVEKIKAPRTLRELQIRNNSGELDILMKTSEDREGEAEILHILHNEEKEVLFLLSGQEKITIQHNSPFNREKDPTGKEIPWPKHALLTEPAWWLNLPERILRLPKKANGARWTTLNTYQRNYQSPGGCTLAEALYLAGVEFVTDTSLLDFPWSPEAEIVEVSYLKAPITNIFYRQSERVLDATKFKKKEVEKPYPLRNYSDRYKLRQKELGRATQILKETLEWGFPEKTTTPPKQKAEEALAELLFDRKPGDAENSREEAVEMIGADRMAILISSAGENTKAGRIEVQFLLHEVLTYGKKNLHNGIQNLAISFYPGSGTSNRNTELSLPEKETLYAKDKAALEQFLRTHGRNSFAEIFRESNQTAIRHLPKFEIAGIIPPEARTPELAARFINWWVIASTPGRGSENYYLNQLPKQAFHQAFFCYIPLLEKIIETEQNFNNPSILKFIKEINTAIAEGI
jgi:hypothetical protein